VKHPADVWQKGIVTGQERKWWSIAAARCCNAAAHRA